MSIWRCSENYRKLEFGLSRTLVAECATSVLAIACAVSSADAFAQGAPVSPITVVPQSIAPLAPEKGFKVDIPDGGAIAPPSGAEAMWTEIGDVRVEGGFAEVSAATEGVLAELRGKRVTLAQIYAAASAIEAAHARAGFVLARVSVPPQQLSPGAMLRLVVTDGYIESVDVSGLSVRARQAAMARAGKLVGKRHLRLAQIEEPLLRVGDIAGLSLRSTLMRGDQSGGSKLVLEGQHQWFGVNLAADNQLDASLGKWGVSARVAINSALGLGEQAYGFVATGYQLGELFKANPRERVLGGGIILPLGSGRITLNPEATFARTAPDALPGAPQTLGTLRRLTMRVSDSLLRTRRAQAGMNVAVEQVEEASTAPAFDVTISRDRFMVARIGGYYNGRSVSGAFSYGASVQLSQGLGDLGAISAAESASGGVPFSRLNAGTGFTHLNLSMNAAWAIGKRFGVSLSGRGQTSFGRALFRAEQVSLEGADGLSAYLGGRAVVDAGFVGRVEISNHAMLASGAKALLPGVEPYIFGAFGTGRLEAPTVLEPGSVSAFNFGGGLRATLAERLGVGVEYARGFSHARALDGVGRVNLTTTLRF